MLFCTNFRVCQRTVIVCGLCWTVSYNKCYVMKNLSLSWLHTNVSAERLFSFILFMYFLQVLLLLFYSVPLIFHNTLYTKTVVCSHIELSSALQLELKFCFCLHMMLSRLNHHITASIAINNVACLDRTFPTVLI